jgi:N utilization substance protein B
MLSRRLVRIKALQSVYGFRQSEDQSPDFLLSLYQQNIDNLQKAYYHGIQFIKALEYFLLSEIDIETSKYFPEQERIRKFRLLSNNSLIPILDASTDLEKQVKRLSITWDDEGETIHRFIKELEEKSFVQDYLVFDQPSFKVSQKFLIQLIEFAFGKSKEIAEAMENAVITWQDDKRVVLRAMVATLKDLEKEGDVLSLYRFEEHAKTEVSFGQKLALKAIKHEAELLEVLQSHIKNWEVDRIAQTDQIVILLAACEFLYFEDIPVKVTINEYLEIAKVYSTPQSSSFINGVLDSLKSQFSKEGKLDKNEKGLREK